MYKNVLLDLGTNVDGHLIANVANFCEKANARLTVLNVFEEPSQSVSTYFSNQKKDLREMVLESHEARLAEELAATKLDQSKINTEIRWGKDFIETIKLVQERGHDLLISASQEPSGAPDSTAMHLMRKSPCPVWIHRGDLWRGAVRILAAVNTSDITEENRRLNLKILQHATHLNEILHGRLHVITCWSGYMESVLVSPRFGERERIEYLNYEQRQAESELSRLMTEAGVSDAVRPKVVHGSPAQVIPQYASEQKMDVVVMGTVARTGVPGLLVGNTAERIITTLENSILAVKPDGFVSPVR